MKAGSSGGKGVGGGGISVRTASGARGCGSGNKANTNLWISKNKVIYDELSRINAQGG